MAQGSASSSAIVEESVALAHRWAAEAAAAEVDSAAGRLAGVLREKNGLPFTLGFVDGVMRPESVSAAASTLHRIAPLVPDFLPWHLRAAVRVGGEVAPTLPIPTVPIARRVMRDLVGHLVVDARPDKLGPAIERLRESGARLNLNLLGEAVLGETEAQRRLNGIHELIRRPDVEYVSVKVSAIVDRISMWAFDETVEDVVARLLPLYLTAAGGDGAAPTFINLDMEEYRDLDLTIAVFTRILEDPRLQDLEAGIVLQAYLPDTLPALQELTAWARQRVDKGGAPIKVRLVKGANLPMERVEAALHGWPLAPYDTKLDADANYLRCLDFAFTPEHARAVRIGVAGHNLFDIAYAWLLAGERDVRGAIQFEMLLGMAQGQTQAVSREVGPVLLYVPVVHPREFDVAIGYLVRRLDESASSENFLSAAFELDSDPELWERERDRFVQSVERATATSLAIGPRRRQDRGAETSGASGTASASDDAASSMTDSITRPIRDRAEWGLTQAVLGISRGAAGASDDPHPAVTAFGGAQQIETAVYASHEDEAHAVGLPGFQNVPDSDPALAANREWARQVFARIETSTAGEHIISAARLTSSDALDAVINEVRDAAEEWGRMPAADRARVLENAARTLEAHRGELIEVAAAETGKTFAEADIEVSEAVDFAAYYAASARELDSVAGAVFEPLRLTVVAPPWNFPLAIPAGGVLAALAAGSGVVFKPAPQARRSGAVIAEALWRAGVPRALLALADIDEATLGRHLIAHPAVDRVILTGSWETAALFRSWRPDLPLIAETSGKNAIVVMPSADIDLAVADLVRSAFGHAGQKCSAASLAILVGPVARSQRFARQLLDATRSLRVGWPSDPRTEIGPVIEAPTGKLAWALSTLDDGERWLIEPEALDPAPTGTGRLWRPGIRTGVEQGSRFHLEEFFGPVLGIMHAPTLAHAIELQNAVPYGLTAGLHTQDSADLAQWLATVEAGNLYVNRGVTGAIVQRQPFGGWKRSAVGPGAKTGGPNYLASLGSWRPSAGGQASSTLHLRGLDSRITALVEAAQPTLDFDSFEWLRRGALSDAVAWDREFGQVKDVSGLGVERNLFRYRPVPVAIRATGDAPWRAALRVVVAAVRAGAEYTLSAPVGLPPEVRRALGELDVTVYVETDEEWVERMRGGEASAPRPSRVRIVGAQDSVARLRLALAVAIDGDPDVAVYANEVTTAGRVELLPFVREQSITITAHRFGNPDPWSESVI